MGIAGIILLVVFVLIIIAGIIFDYVNRKKMTEEQKKQNPGPLKSLLVIIGVFAACAVIVVGIIFGIFYYRKIGNDEIELNYSPNITAAGMDCEVTAKKDVRDLELEFTFYNNKEEKIYTLKKYVGDIDKGQSKKVTVSIFEVMSSSIPITCSIEISDGKKGFFAIFQ